MGTLFLSGGTGITIDGKEQGSIQINTNLVGPAVHLDSKSGAAGVYVSRADGSQLLLETDLAKALITVNKKGAGFVLRNKQEAYVGMWNGPETGPHMRIVNSAKKTLFVAP